jgi:hypothetical protein
MSWFITDISLLRSEDGFFAFLLLYISSLRD